MSDNELDNLFKEAAEGFTPPQDASAWKQMSAMLDQSVTQSAGFWNWKTISGVTASGIIAITAIVWFAVNNSSGNQQAISKQQNQHESGNTTQSAVQEQKEQANPADTENLTPAESVESKGAQSRIVKGSEGKLLLSNKFSGNSDNNTSSSVNNSKTDQDFILPASTEDKLPQSEAKFFAGSQEQSRSLSIQDKLLIESDSDKVDIPVIKLDSTKLTSNDEERKDKPVLSGSRISIKAALSPDYSSVDYFSAGKTGTNFGLLAGYSFNNRWSVYTGVISSRKRYDTNDVKGSYSSDGHDYPLKELDGDCRILDIPITVYYTFFPQRPFSLRAGLGFSSYIMNREKYVYCVDSYGSDVYYEQDIRGKNNEWFKVMNLSLMVSRRFGNRMSAEFEPFVKAPLAGVGEGKVSLVSMGAFINLKYDLFILK